VLQKIFQPHLLAARGLPRAQNLVWSESFGDTTLMAMPIRSRPTLAAGGRE
jgi:hypothetical protein